MSIYFSSLDQQDEPAKKTIKITPPNAESEAPQSEKVDAAESTAGNDSRNSKIVVPVTYRPSAMQKVAVLPGFLGYQRTSGSDSDDSSSDDEDVYNFPLISQTNATGSAKSRRAANMADGQCQGQN